MKKTVFVSALGLAATGLVSAQGLYNMMPYDDEPADALPLNWTVGASIGWDSNPTPTFSECPGVDSDEALYLSGFVQANFVSKTPQTTFDVWARVGAVYYLDNIEQSVGAGGTTVKDDFFPNFRGGINFVHRVNERLRIRSRNDATYEQEPDYDYGIATDRRQGNYVRYSSDTSVGYRWTERLATNTGYRINGVIFDDVDGEDYLRHLFYNQFRYRLSPSTVATLAYRYGLQNNDAGTDSDSHYILVGVEHELSPTTVLVLRGGGQYFSPDGGDSQWSPYVEAMIRSALSERASVRGFVRYGIEDRNRRIATHDCNALTMPALQSIGIYDSRKVLRFGGQGSYAVSDRLSIYAGANLILTSYEDPTPASSPLAPSSLDESVFNVNVGGQFEITQNIYATASYNFTTASSDAGIREYDRSRVQVGVQATF